MLLEIENLNVKFETRKGLLHVIKDLSYSVNLGETLGIVGESGCGKSVSSLALMGLLPNNAQIRATKLQFEKHDLLTLPENERRKLRGADISMIFQDPMTALNPSFTVGFQLMETIKVHRGGTSAQIKKECIKLLEQVGIPAPESRLNNYPHQMSGGMCQRIMIAMAIACRPKLLIADEPTTALDVTIQAQILGLLKNLQKEYGMGLILITHNIGVVANMADRIMVMYAGEAVETGRISDVLKNPHHPYTKGLLNSIPDAHRGKGGEKSIRVPLPSIPGMVPDLSNRPSGCQFNPRCEFVENRCKTETQKLIGVDSTHLSRCFKPLGEKR